MCDRTNETTFLPDRSGGAGTLISNVGMLGSHSETYPSHWPLDLQFDRLAPGWDKWHWPRSARNLGGGCAVRNRASKPKGWLTAHKALFPPTKSVAIHGGPVNEFSLASPQLWLGPWLVNCENPCQPLFFPPETRRTDFFPSFISNTQHKSKPSFGLSTPFCLDISSGSLPPVQGW